MIETTVMGSHPQPDWLVDRDLLLGASVPRTRREEIWRVDPAERADAIEAATLGAIADQENAGVDVITDGEIGRESYFNHFATSLGGVSVDHVGDGTNRRGDRVAVPLVTGPIERTHPIEADAARFLRAHTVRRTKVTVPGPFTLSRLAEDRHYGDERALALAYAAAVNAELRELEAIGIDVLQLDEPYLQSDPDAARAIAVEAIAAAVDGIGASTTVHTCYGYAAYVSDKTDGYPFLDELAAAPVDHIAIETAQPDLDPAVVARLAPRGVVLGVLDLGRSDPESAVEIAGRIRAALEHLEPDRLMVGPDCGMKYLAPDLARAKLAAMVEGAAIVRAEVAGT